MSAEADNAVARRFHSAGSRREIAGALAGANSLPVNPTSPPADTGRRPS